MSLYQDTHTQRARVRKERGREKGREREEEKERKEGRKGVLVSLLLLIRTQFYWIRVLPL
jgi:hypothetical protein